MAKWGLQPSQMNSPRAMPIAIIIPHGSQERHAEEGNGDNQNSQR